MATAAEQAKANQQQADDQKAAQDTQAEEAVKAQAKADEEKKAAQDAQDNASDAHGIQKYRVQVGVLSARVAGSTQPQMITHGKVIELNADDEDTQKLVALHAIELASEPYKGRVTAKNIVDAAREFNQEDPLPEPVAGGDGQPLVQADEDDS